MDAIFVVLPDVKFQRNISGITMTTSPDKESVMVYTVHLTPPPPPLAIQNSTQVNSSQNDLCTSEYKRQRTATDIQQCQQSSSTVNSAHNEVVIERVGVPVSQSRPRRHPALQGRLQRGVLGGA